MKKNARRIITGLLLLSLTCSTLKADDITSVTLDSGIVSAQTSVDPLNPKIGQVYASLASPQPKVSAAVCVVTGLAIALLWYSIYKCAKVLTNTNSTSTNSANFVTKDVPPGPGGGTGGTGTNAYNGPVVFDTTIPCSTILATNNDANAEVCMDISGSGQKDWQGNPLTWEFITQTDPTGPHVQSSTNLVDWTDEFNSVTMWVSSTVSPDPYMQYFTNVTTVVYDGAGYPIITNHSPIIPGQLINVGLRTGQNPVKYFRGVTPAPAP